MRQLLVLWGVACAGSSYKDHPDVTVTGGGVNEADDAADLADTASEQDSPTQPASEPNEPSEPAQPTSEPSGEPDWQQLEQEVCDLWGGVTSQSGVTWDGNISSCDEGELASGSISATIELINAVRSFSGLSSIEDSNSRNQLAQSCALIMHANNSLSHYPDSNWACYSEQGATGAGESLIATTNSITSIGLYLNDYGNNDTLGHRRWLLAPTLVEVGIGSTSEFSCVHVSHNFFSGPPQTWPPNGMIPETLYRSSWYDTDSTGWSIQSSESLEQANVIVKIDGVEASIELYELLPNYGSANALRIVPSGWSTQPGKTYTIEVTGIDQPVRTDFQLARCD